MYIKIIHAAQSILLENNVFGGAQYDLFKVRQRHFKKVLKVDTLIQTKMFRKKKCYRKIFALTERMRNWPEETAQRDE